MKDYCPFQIEEKRHGKQEKDQSLATKVKQNAQRKSDCRTAKT